MTVLHIILAVVLVFVIVFAFIFSSPLFVKIVFREQLLVYAGISFVKIKVFPQSEKKKKKKKSSAKNAKVKKSISPSENEEKNEGTASEKNSTVKEPKKNSVKETLSLILDIVKEVFYVMGKKAEIKITSLKVWVSKPDAADTAVQFGLCQGIVSTLLAFSSEFSKSHINGENVSVTPDFVSGKSRLETDITLKVPAGALLFSILRGYFKNQFRQK